MTRQVSLLVNEQPVALDYFVQGFIDHVVGAILTALKSTGKIKTLDISIRR